MCWANNKAVNPFFSSYLALRAFISTNLKAVNSMLPNLPLVESTISQETYELWFLRESH